MRIKVELINIVSESDSGVEGSGHVDNLQTKHVNHLVLESISHQITSRNYRINVKETPP